MRTVGGKIINFVTCRKKKDKQLLSKSKLLHTGNRHSTKHNQFAISKRLLLKKIVK